MNAWNEWELQDYDPASGAVLVRNSSTGQSVPMHVSALNIDQRHALGVQEFFPNNPQVSVEPRIFKTQGSYTIDQPAPVPTPRPVSYSSDPLAPINPLEKSAKRAKPINEADYAIDSPGITGTVVSSEPTASPAESALLAGTSKQEKAIQKLGEIESEKQKAVSAIYEQGQKNLETYQAKAREIQDAQAASYEADRKAIDSAILEAQKPIDPNRWWKSKGTGGKVQAGIAIALGALGDALTRVGGTGGIGNQALNIIMKSIDDDILVQREELASKRGAVGTKFSLLNTNLQKFGDERQALAATRAQYIENLQFQINSQAAKSGSEEAKAKADQLTGALQVEKGKLLTEFDKLATEKAMLNARASANPNAKAQPFISGMVNAEQTLEAIRQKGTKKPDFVFTSSDEQTFERAADQWAINYLKASGGRISPEAVKQVRRAYFPTKWTFDKAADRLREARQNAMNALGASGPATEEEILNEDI